MCNVSARRRNNICVTRGRSTFICHYQWSIKPKGRPIYNLTVCLTQACDLLVIRSSQTASPHEFLNLKIENLI